MSQWHIITSEYPPQHGGVSDYTKLVARGLAAAGDEVHVWCPAGKEGAGAATGGGEREEAKLVVHRDFGSFAPEDLRRVGNRLNEFPAPRRLLVQWVPQGYGYRSVNLPFCFWLRRRAKHKHDRVELMVHEPFLPFREGTRKQDVAAAVHRLMIATLLQAASQVWVSIPDWETRLRPFARADKPFSWLPVPNNIPVANDPEGITQIRSRYSAGMQLVGHFGAYDRYMTEFMSQFLPALLAETEVLSVLLLGKGSLELRDRIIEARTELAARLHATGMLPAEQVSRHISACDVMLQPYQDGVSGRRTSVMSALAHGVPVVTTEGKATESCWAESGAVTLTRPGDMSGIAEAVWRLLKDEKMRDSMSHLGVKLYQEKFAIERTISALLQSSSAHTLKTSGCAALSARTDGPSRGQSEEASV